MKRIHRSLLAAALLAACLLHPFTLSAQSPIETIQSLMAEGKLDEGLRLTNEELDRDPDNVNYQFLKGLILIRLDRIDQAEKVFKEITTQHPELPEPYNNLAVIYASMGEFDKARQALQEAINTHPSYATAHENMGDIYAKLASRAYNQALQLDQENPTAKAKLALINDLFSLPKAERAALTQAPEVSAASEEQAAVASPEEQQPPTPSAGPAGATDRGESVDKQALKQQASRDIRAAVSSWAEAWSSQDVDDYLAHYGDEFTPPSGLTRGEWEQERRERLSSPRFIRLDVSDLQVAMLGDKHAQVTFTQKYQSDTYGDRVTKLLLLVKKEDNWLIVQEATK